MASKLVNLFSAGLAVSVMALSAQGGFAHEMSQLHIHQKVQKGAHKQQVPQGQIVTNTQQVRTQQVVIEDTIEVSDDIVPARRTVIGEYYKPTIWIDPDGCEHWVMDDGREGYMTPHVHRQGIPKCHRANACGVMNTDQMFSSGSSKLNRASRAGLKKFFATAEATAYIIVGHTDSRASDDYNLKLSYKRASAVATVAQSMGVRIADVRGLGERHPIAKNNTSRGMAKNRRVEILCVR